MDDKIINYTDTGGMLLPRRITSPPIITDSALTDALNKWNSYLPRYRRLYRYYIGDHDITRREGQGPLAVSNLCRYITKVINGYLVGNAPSYSAQEGDIYGEEIIELFRKQSKSSVESEICKNLSIYGSALELVYLDEEGIPKSAVLSPREAFVAYETSIEGDSVYGAVVYPKKDKNNKDYYELHVYTRTDVEVWRSPSSSGGWTRIGDPVPHGFGRVPLIEYINDGDRMGDFESVISLQDRYNSLLTDRLDDKDAFVRSTLIIQGHVLGMSHDEVEESVENMNKLRVLQLNEGGSVSYLDRIMDENGVQILQDQLASDIHKVAMVPDLSDEQFSSNASGVAMAYKLFGTDQVASEKIARIQKGFSRRCKLYDTALFNSQRSESYTPSAVIQDMKITFRLNTTQDIAYMANAFTQLTGSRILSRSTARAHLSIVDDPRAEGEKVALEQEEDAESMRMSFEDDFALDIDEEEL